MGKIEKGISVSASIVVLLGIAYGIGESFADKPTTDETRVIARQEISSALDTFKQRYGFEMHYLRTDVDTVKSELRANAASVQKQLEKIEARMKEQK